MIHTRTRTHTHTRTQTHARKHSHTRAPTYTHVAHVHIHMRTHTHKIKLAFHSFIHSGHFYSAPSSPLLLRGAPDYSTDTVSEFHAEARAHTHTHTFKTEHLVQWYWRTDISPCKGR